jgi:hypothetical protein
VRAVRFARFARGRAREARVVSRRRGGRLVVRLRIGGRSLRPTAQVLRRTPVAPSAPVAPPAPPVAPPPHTPLAPRGGGGCATSDGALDARWTTWGPGWSGGDGTYSVPLPDGRVAWIFQDSFVGAVRADRSRDFAGFVRNAVVLQDGGGELTTLGTGKTFVETGEDGSWYWPADGTVDGGRLRVLLWKFVRKDGGGGVWDFRYTGAALATFDATSTRVESITPVPVSGTITWGSAVLEDGGTTYVYGIEDHGIEKNMYVARTTNGLSGAWQYWTGADWSSVPSAARYVHQGVSNQFSVLRRGDHFLLVSQANTFGRELWAAAGSSPTGPWSAPRTFYTTPEWGPRDFTYNAVAHPELGGDLVVSYNVNSHDPNDALADADHYRPRFVRVPDACLPG